MIRAFLAVPLPDAVTAYLTTIQQHLRLPPTASTPLPRENLHITLVFLGNHREQTLDTLHQELEALRPAGFTLRLDALDVFGGDRPRNLHVRIARETALEALQSKLCRTARMAGIHPEKRRFIPHVTLFRFRPGAAEPAMLASALQRMGAPAPMRFEVQRYGLFRSHLRPDGAQYDLLAEYPLTRPLLPVP